MLKKTIYYGGDSSDYDRDRNGGKNYSKIKFETTSNFDGHNSDTDDDVIRQRKK